jgi:hypothetical protein
MKKALIDASSAIILTKAGLFEKILDLYEVRMARSVFEEITCEQRPGVAAFKAGRRDRHFSVVEAKDGNSGRTAADPVLAGMHRGERETIQRFHEGAEDFIIIDDGKGAGYCRAHHIPYINALLCPKILYFQGKICEPDFNEAFLHITTIGRYSRVVVEQAAGLSARELTFFLA